VQDGRVVHSQVLGAYHACSLCLLCLCACILSAFLLHDLPGRLFCGVPARWNSLLPFFTHCMGQAGKQANRPESVEVFCSCCSHASALPFSSQVEAVRRIWSLISFLILLCKLPAVQIRTMPFLPECSAFCCTCLPLFSACLECISAFLCYSWTLPLLPFLPEGKEILLHYVLAGGSDLFVRFSSRFCAAVSAISPPFSGSRQVGWRCRTLLALTRCHLCILCVASFVTVVRLCICLTFPLTIVTWITSPCRDRASAAPSASRYPAICIALHCCTFYCTHFTFCLSEQDL